MSKIVSFFKVAGCGNDFILVDARSKKAPSQPAILAKTWCDRKQGVGADGLLLVLPSKKASARMRIFNSDGSEASMCGNGLRCVAWYLHASNGKHRRSDIETGAGLLRTEVVGTESVRAYWDAPASIRLGLKLTHQGSIYRVHAVNTGVPHAVLLVRNLKQVDPETLGPVIRRHKLFRPGGTNVNWVKIHSPHRISVRTFERGVEGETLACGTGAVASAVIGTALGRLAPPVKVQTAGGDVMTVNFRQERKPWEGLSLEGPARILFEGRLST